ncbi:competence/damage-inducible protein CinA-like protein [Rhodobacteraceae bacterium HIMB11]|nr:competence/damage-inducible protein CinA-like protein [Rhodobacteraceae bacterium HIMB11]
MSLAKDVVERASAAGIVIATAESCTGGMISAAITAIAGSSRVLDRGFVTYSNAAKIDILGISAETLDTQGAVSEQVAAEMAAGALKHSNATLSVSVTGIAGPGGSDFKPEGRVCFGIATNDGVETQQIDFGALGRTGVREATVAHALELLLEKLPN